MLEIRRHGPFINISGKPFRNKYVTFKEKYLKFIFVNSSSEDCVQHRLVYSMFRLRICSSLLQATMAILAHLYQVFTD